MTDMQEVITAIAKAKGMVRKIGKADKNQHDGYKFASIDAFLEMVNPIMAECGLVTIADEENVDEFSKQGRNGETPWLRLTYLLTVYHVSGQSMPPVRRRVEILRNGAQAFGSAQSYVLKQFHRGLLEIPTGDGDDADHRATDASPIRRAESRTFTRNGTPHDPETGEVAEDDPNPPSVKDFIVQVKEGLAMAGNNNPSREQIEHAYGMAVIENIARRKGSARAGQWFNIFCELHSEAIGRIQDADLRKQVRSAIALKGEQIAGKNPDPAEFGFPFGDHVGAEFGLPPA